MLIKNILIDRMKLSKITKIIKNKIFKLIFMFCVMLCIIDLYAFSIA